MMLLAKISKKSIDYLNDPLLPGEQMKPSGLWTQRLLIDCIELETIEFKGSNLNVHNTPKGIWTERTELSKLTTLSDSPKGY